MACYSQRGFTAPDTNADTTAACQLFPGNLVLADRLPGGWLCHPSSCGQVRVLLASQAISTDVREAAEGAVLWMLLSSV